MLKSGIADVGDSKKYKVYPLCDDKLKPADEQELNNVFKSNDGRLGTVGLPIPGGPPGIGGPLGFGDPPGIGGFFGTIGTAFHKFGMGLSKAVGASVHGLSSTFGLFGKGIHGGFSATMRALGAPQKGRWINNEDYAKLLPQRADDSDMEFVGGHMGIAAAMTAHWVWHNQARIALYVLALLSMALLATGLYLYMHDYQLFVQREKDQKNGVYRPEALIAKERKAQEYKVVNYVPLTPPNLAYVTESDRLTNRFYNM